MERSKGDGATPVGHGRPTIRAVAELAGVSKSLVSLALRGSDKVSPESRRAVLDAAAALGYQANAAARNLAQQRSNLVGVVISHLRNPWYVDVLDGLTGTLEAFGTSVVLGDGKIELKRHEQAIRTFGEMRADGLVLVGPMPLLESTALAMSHMPSVVVGSREERAAGTSLITSDDHVGAALATEHLIRLGHSRIAHIAGIRAAGQIRQRSFEQTMTAAGLDPGIVETCDMTEDGGYRAAVRILTSPRRPTAIFAGNDLTAIGCLSAAHELGLTVPRDLSVVGYDNMYVAGLRHIGLTTIDTAGFEIGRIVAHHLMDRIRNPRTEPVTMLVEPSLQVRTSTAAPGT